MTSEGSSAERRRPGSGSGGPGTAREAQAEEAGAAPAPPPPQRQWRPSGSAGPCPAPRRCWGSPGATGSTLLNFTGTTVSGRPPPPPTRAALLPVGGPGRRCPPPPPYYPLLPNPGPDLLGSPSAARAEGSRWAAPSSPLPLPGTVLPSIPERRCPPGGSASGAGAVPGGCALSSGHFLFQELH